MEQSTDTAATFPQLPPPPPKLEEAVATATAEQFAQMKVYMDGQIQMLSQHCVSLQSQLNSLKDTVNAKDKDVALRIERLTTLMSHHMACFKQLVELVNNYGDQLTEKEKLDAKRELAYSNLVDRQNRFAAGLAKLEQNTKDIVEELDILKSHDDEQDKFKFRITCILTLGAALIGWLLAGDNFAKIIVAVKSACGF